MKQRIILEKATSLEQVDDCPFPAELIGRLELLATDYCDGRVEKVGQVDEYGRPVQEITFERGGKEVDGKHYFTHDEALEVM